MAAVVFEYVHRFQMFEQRRTGVPRHPWRRRQHVVAVQRRQRDRGDVGDAELRGQRAIVLDDACEDGFVAIDQIHLVDREHHVPDAQQRHDIAVPPGLGEQTLARVHQHDREIRGGCAGRHVAGVLLVARTIGDDELATIGVEKAVGDVDGNALLALGLQPVDQQREIDPAVLGAVAQAVGFERRQLVVQQQPGVVQQAPDQRALAVVDAAAGDETQQLLALVLFQIGGDGGIGVGRGGEGGAHQK
jgi:hypothetical protein